MIVVVKLKINGKVNVLPVKAGILFKKKSACPSENSSNKKLNSPKSLSLKNISIQENTYCPTGSKEFDRVVGGGISKKSIILLSGAPGVGKSTLVTHIVSNMKENVLYVSGEESISQVATRFKRVCVNNDLVFISTENNIPSITDEIIMLKPKIVIIDSIQTISIERGDSLKTIATTKEVMSEIMSLCNDYDVTFVVLGHVVKDGSMAGPKFLEHMVDVVLFFEYLDEENARILRCSKNRFGQQEK